MIYFRIERFILSKTTLHFSKMWTLLVYGVLLITYHLIQQNVNSWYVHFHEKTTLPPLCLLGSEIEKVDSIKYLDLTIKDNLSWSDHISKICSKARRLVGMLF